MNSLVKPLFVAVACVGLGLALAAGAYILVQNYYQNTGEIATLELYLDRTFYSNASTIDWGSCEPGGIYYFENMTVLNNGEVDLLVTIITDGLPSDWLLEWGYNNTVITAGTYKAAELNLTIPAAATSWPTWGFYLNGEEPSVAT